MSAMYGAWGMVDKEMCAEGFGNTLNDFPTSRAEVGAKCEIDK